MSHTELPWDVVDAGGVPIGVGRDIGDGCYEMICNAILAENMTRADLETIRENLRRMAAAPDLLEACRAFLRAWQHAGPSGSHQFEKFDTAVRLAEAAIAKAEGETT